MGIDKITKLLKRCNKGKNTITMGIVVAFLLGSSSSYGEIRIEYDSNTNKVIIYNGESSIPETDKTFGEIVQGEIIDGKTNFTWKYNGVLSEEIFLEDSLFNGEITFNIENNGIIGKQIGNKFQNDNDNVLNKGNGIGIYSKEKNLILGNILNNGIITGSNNESATERYSNIGNGIGIYSGQGKTLTLGNILNNGIITGSESTSSNNYSNIGNGIGLFTNNGTLNLGNILNNGIITGSSNESVTNDYSNIGNGIGVFNYREYDISILNLENIFNYGISEGNGSTNSNNSNVGNGIGVFNEADVNRNNLLSLENIFNYGISEGNGNNNSISSNVGNGIDISNIVGTLELENILNNGISKGTENGIKIYNFSSRSNSNLKIENILNNGISNRNIDSNSSNIGNGIKIYNHAGNYGEVKLTIENILNNGISKGIENGIEIYNQNEDRFTVTLTINNILNSGLTQGNKNGLYFHNENGDVTLNGKIQNIGTIIGENGSAVDFSTSGIANVNDKYSNYGVVVEKSNDGVNTNVNDGTNANGIYITLDDSGIASIERKESGEVSGILQFDKNGDKTGTKEYYIINGETTVDKKATTTINSSGLADKIEESKRGKYVTDENNKKTFSNLIINGAENTLTIDNDLKISNSVINSYKNSVVFAEKGGSLNGTNIVINTGNFDDSFAITGAEGTDNIILDSSIINGKIDLENGDTGNSQDSLTISNGTIINGDIKLNNNDKFTSTSVGTDNQTTINGNIESNNSTLSFTDTMLNGEIKLDNDKFKSMSTTSISTSVGTDNQTTINGNITSNNSELSFTNTIINGNITLDKDVSTSEKANKETIFDKSIVNGKVELYSGTFTGKNSTLNGEIGILNGGKGKITGTTVADGDITITNGQLDVEGTGQVQRFNTGATTVNGDIIVENEGVLYLHGNNFVINGDINFTGTKANLTVDENFSKDKMNGEFIFEQAVKEKNLILTYTVNDTTQDIFKKQLGEFSEFTINLNDEGNTVDLRGLDFKFNGTINSKNGKDEFTIDNFDVKISDNGSNDDDILKLVGISVNNDNIGELGKYTGIENLQLADNGNTINVSGLSFENIVGGSGVDVFKISDISDLENITLNGNVNQGDTKDVLELGAVVNGDTSFDGISKKVENVEELKLFNGTTNTLNIDNLISTPFTTITGGNQGDTFILNSLDSDLSLTINGGSGDDIFTLKSFNSKININGGDSALNGDTVQLGFALTGDNQKDILSGEKIKGFENLELADSSNTVTIDDIVNNKNNSFKKLTGGDKDDKFIVDDLSNLSKITLIGGTGTEDILQLKGKVDESNSFGNISGVEHFQLVFSNEGEGNVIVLDSLNGDVKKVTGSSGADEFKIDNSNKKDLEIIGGDGSNTLTIDNITIQNAVDLSKVSQVEKLNLNSSGNIFTLTDSFENVNLTASNNNITLDNLSEKNIIFGESLTNNVVNIQSDNGNINHTIANANEIKLNGSDKFVFAKENMVSGKDVLIDIGTKTVDFTKGEKELSSGLSMFGDKLVFSNDIANFIANGSSVVFSNGTIKIGLDSNVKFANGVNTKFTISSGDKIKFDSTDSSISFESYAFLNTANKENNFTFSVKSWEDLLDDLYGNSDENKEDKEKQKIYADTYDDIIRNFNGTGYEDETTALKTFGADAISEYIRKVVEFGHTETLTLLSEKGEFSSVVKNKKIFIGTDSGATDKSTDLLFENLVSTGEFDVDLTGGENNIISFAGAVTLKNGIDASGSTENVTINLNNPDNSENNNSENSKFDIKEIIFGIGGGTVKIADTSLITKLGAISGVNSDDVNKIVIQAEKIEKENGFGKLVSSAYKEGKLSVGNIEIINQNDILIKNDYTGNLKFTAEGNIVSFDTNYTGNVVFDKGDNNITVNSEINGDKFTFTGNKNTVSVGENGDITGTLTFSKEAGDTFKVTKKITDNGDDENKNNIAIFDYKVANADEIILSGVNNQKDIQWNFSKDSAISGTNLSVKVEDNGAINFIVGKNADNKLILGENGVNPFANSGNYTINGNVKLTFDNSIKFTSLSDSLSVDKSYISLGTQGNLILPSFMKYDETTQTISIKQKDELKLNGLKEIGYGNYEYLVLNYNKDNNEGITKFLNQKSESELIEKLNTGAMEIGDFHFYSDDGTYDDKIYMKTLYVETTNDKNVKDEDKNTKITFNDIVVNDVIKIAFAVGTENEVSIKGENILGNGIDGRESKERFTLNLDKITFGENSKSKEIVLGQGDDTLNLLSSITSTEGVLDGYKGDNNVLNIGEEVKSLDDNNNSDDNNSENNTSKVIALSGTIKNFKDINLNQDTRLNSDLRFAKQDIANEVFNETEIINLKGNNLILGVDYEAKRDDNGKVIEHALYNAGITVNNDGKILVSTAGANGEVIISMGDDKRSEITGSGEVVAESDSSVHDVELLESGDIKVSLREHVVDDVKYDHLDKIYQSILSAKKIGLMSASTSLDGKGDTEQEAIDNSIKAQLEYYGKIYHSSPYAYSNEVSKKSAELITNSLLENKVMPDLNKWTFGGSIAGREADNSTNYYGQNLHKVDIGKNEVSAESNIYGAYAFGEYGIKENSSIGFAIAGTNGTTDISGGSKLESNAVFVSAYAKQNLGNLSLMAGLGYQHSFYDSTRVASNNYQSTTVDKKYEDDLFTIFAGARYIYNLGNGFSLEPNAKFNISHVMQNDIDEDDNKDEITIEVDSQDFTSIDTEIGIDVVKQINTEKGKLSFKAGVLLVYALEGYKDEFLNARVVGATEDFEIISPESDRARVKFNLGTEYELENGMFYNLHGNYITSSHNTDYSVSFGAGYKF